VGYAAMRALQLTPPFLSRITKVGQHYTLFLGATRKVGQRGVCSKALQDLYYQNPPCIGQGGVFALRMLPARIGCEASVRVSGHWSRGLCVCTSDALILPGVSYKMTGHMNTIDRKKTIHLKHGHHARVCGQGVCLVDSDID
jgi:hypothetical protein